MTRSRIQRIKFFVFLLIFLLAQSAVCDGSFRKEKATASMEKNVNVNVEKTSAQNPPPGETNVQQSVVLSEDTTISDGNKTSVDLNLKSSVDTNRTVQHREHFGDSLNPGALLRGIYVFVGLSVLVMAYIVFRSFRLSKTRAQMVRKYGVLAHRQDVEMRPLPLEEEDDEDTTVFDASNVLSNNAQHQNL